MALRTVTLVLVLQLLAGCAQEARHHDTPSERPHAAVQARRSAADFFVRYVSKDGQVVRHDQGDDTVSEGQAYALLLAAAMRDREHFNRVMSWTKRHLERSDHLFSWHFKDGVLDPQPASDADLDIARALLLAGRVFHYSHFTQRGLQVGRAILRKETAVVDGRRILLPGPWADLAPPTMVNPSYFSPVAIELLYRASGDARWRQLEQGTRQMVRSLSEKNLPPDWAIIQSNGAVAPSTRGPGGEAAFGWDAVRVPMRLAESCVPDDRKLAGSFAARLNTDQSSPMKHPVGWVARAASQAAAGHQASADRALAEALHDRRLNTTYYGDAWEALGRYLLLDKRLGGCPPGSS